MRANVKELEGRYELVFGALADAIDDGCWNPYFPERKADGRLVMDEARLISGPVQAIEVDYSREVTQYPDQFQLQITCPAMFNSLIWTQELLYRDRLLFLNESVSWLENPCIVRENEIYAIELGANWRKKNTVTVVRHEAESE
jgi:hypothetical protein